MKNIVISSSWLDADESSHDSMDRYLTKIFEIIGKYPKVEDVWYEIGNKREYFDFKKKNSLDVLMKFRDSLDYEESDIIFYFELKISNGDWKKIEEKCEYEKDVTIRYEQYSLYYMTKNIMKNEEIIEFEILLWKGY